MHVSCQHVVHIIIIIPVHSISSTCIADAPPPCEESNESEEEQHNGWNQLLELFTVPG